MNESNETVAYVHVSCPSGVRSKQLPPDLTQLAIYLLRTQNKNMAKFALKHPLIRGHLITFIEKEIKKECQEMCRETVKVPTCGESDTNIPGEITQKSQRNLFSTVPGTSGKRKNDDNEIAGPKEKKFVKKDVRSIFKRSSKDDLMSFTFEKAENEMIQRCLLFWGVLRAASTSPHKSEDDVIHWRNLVVTAAAIVLRTDHKE